MAECRRAVAVAAEGGGEDGEVAEECDGGRTRREMDQGCDGGRGGLMKDEARACTTLRGRGSMEHASAALLLSLWRRRRLLCWLSQAPEAYWGLIVVAVMVEQTRPMPRHRRPRPPPQASPSTTPRCPPPPHDTGRLAIPGRDNWRLFTCGWKSEPQRAGLGGRATAAASSSDFQPSLSTHFHFHLHHHHHADLT